MLKTTIDEQKQKAHQTSEKTQTENLGEKMENWRVSGGWWR